ncbi:MAG: hypothetical protein RQ968_01835 [Thermoproteota archaeon]|jgi:hypothetical protein|nr:hypothetical protein [Thermoproteota archaeon]
MSTYVDNIDVIKSRIDNMAKKGIAHIIGLYVFLDSNSILGYDFKNVRDTLEPAFDNITVGNIEFQIREAFKNINKYAKIRNIEVELGEYLKRYILERYSKEILKEIEKRLNQMTEEDKKILSVACAVIDVIKNRNYPVSGMGRNKYEVYLSILNELIKVASSFPDSKMQQVRPLFYKYLLGYQSDCGSRTDVYYYLTIYPFAEPYIEKLASEVSNYVRIPDKQEIRSTLEELYRKGDLPKLAVIEWALSSIYSSDLEFAMHFFDAPYRVMIEGATIEGIISDGRINPLVYDYVKEAMGALYKEAIKELMGLFKSIFEKKGYASLCGRECCTFTHRAEKSILICFLPWPKKKDIYLKEAKETEIRAMVVQGIPAGTFFQYLEKYEANKGFAWFFLDKKNKKLLIPFNLRLKYKEIYYELEQILKEYFTIE